MTIRRLVLIGLLFIPTSCFSTERTSWVMDDTYVGAHSDSYRKLVYEVPILMRQTLIDIAVKTGMNFQDGWAYPMTVGFTDTAPYGAENVLAYVQLFETQVGVEQELRINLAAYDREKFNFDNVLAHELTHAMLNDSLSGAAARVIPAWFHEGLAVYAAGQGEKMLRSYVHSNSGFAAERMLNGLDGPHTALDYAEDYLAFRYIESRYGINGVHMFVREVISRKGDILSALDYSLHENWEDFERHVKEYGREQIKAIGPARRGEYEKPY